MPVRTHLIFYISLFLLAAFLYWKPAYNGDIGYYIAVAAQASGASDSTVISYSDSILQAETPEDTYKQNKGILQRYSPALLDFYRIKPLYIWLIRAAHGVGFSWSRATMVPSLAAFILMMLFAFRWLNQVLGSKALFPALLLMVSYPILAPARMSTPDAMTSFFMVALFYHFLQGGSRTIQVILLSFLVSTRLDNLLIAGIFCVGGGIYAWRVENREWISYLLVLMLLIGSALLLNVWCTRDPLWPMHMEQVLYRGNYLWQLGKAFRYFSASYGWLLIVLLLFMVQLFRMKMQTAEITMLVMMASMVIIRLLLFPAYEERFFGGYYMVSCILILRILKRWKENVA
jgi:hypothetical protein